MADYSTVNSWRVIHLCILSAFSFTALIFTVFRLSARRIMKVKLELNDYLCVVGLVFTLGLAVFTMCDTIYPVLNSTNTDLSWGNKALLAGQLLWVTAVTFIRASVLSLYIRIVPTPSFRATCYVVQCFNLAYYVAVVLAGILICRPLAFLWDQSIDGSCGDQKSFDLFIGLFNLLMDITTVALPMPVLRGLQMPTKKKLAIAGMFSLGAAICVITIVRIKITTSINGQNHPYADIALYTCLEALLGIACLPVIRPIFTKHIAMGILNLGWTPKSTATSGKPMNTPQSNRIDQLYSGAGKYPSKSLPIQIVREDSLHMFSPDLPTEVREPSTPLPSFSWRPLSKYHLPGAEREQEPPEIRNRLDRPMYWISDYTGEDAGGGPTGMHAAF